MKRQVSETIRKLRNMILTGFKPIKKRLVTVGDGTSIYVGAGLIYSRYLRTAS